MCVVCDSDLKIMNIICGWCILWKIVEDSGNPYTPEIIYTVTKPHNTTRSEAQKMPFPYPKYSGMMLWSLEATFCLKACMEI
ncbi:unnamed protein product [Leptidea sinapis]|uniref:Uncharacterized protein n=1 Tax=Leptidea sinapis TaxID=189913 RepID=A0A5E4PM63_9NEOP|nr:unnamed protein product [Leptidea sinapis]